MTVQERWNEVKEFYETNYRVIFKTIPSEDQIVDLYKRMRLVKSSLARFYEAETGLRRNYFKKAGIQEPQG